MFTAAVEDIFKRINVEAGINVDTKTLNNLRFADDIIVFAESGEQLKNLLEDLSEKTTKPTCNDLETRNNLGRLATIK